jgi:hypothetical protein
MADISDVEQAVADAITASLYPGGSTQSSIVGSLYRVYRGWPNTATLNMDLTAGAVNVSVVTDNDSGKTTTRYLPDWEYAPLQPGTTATATSSSITVDGTPIVGDVIGALVDGYAYTYRIQSGDSTGLVAANLAQLIENHRIALVHDATIDLPGARSIVARTVRDCPTFFENRRQEKDVRIICWCPSPVVRDAVAATIDAALNQINFLPLADNTTARIVYRNTANYDQAQNALLYRRDLIYTAEYPTVTKLEQPLMIFGAAAVNGNITFG